MKRTELMAEFDSIAVLPAVRSEKSPRMKNEIVMASLVAFIASFCILVIELVAGRIMAPHVGVSLYTWTSIIGVVLAGISLGAYLGGMLADRRPHRSTLGWLLLAAGLMAFTIAPITDFAGNSAFLEGVTTLMVRILLLTTLVFFVPSLLLGMVSPVVIKLAVKNLDKTGNVVGKISAFSTLGSILGTFATGFFLIEAMGTRTILYSVGVILTLCAPLFGGWLSRRDGRTPRSIATIQMLFLTSILALFWFKRESIARPLYFSSDYFFFKESDYYTIMIGDGDHPANQKEPKQVSLRTLALDHLTHSYTKMDDPYYMHYGYLKACQELVAWRTREEEAPRFLFIGGGGYTLPRYMDVKYPKAIIDVVEIDPWITRVVEQYFDVKARRINSFNEDGRWFVANCRQKYNFIFGDAFNDLSIPYHLTTREFNTLIKGILEPDGLFTALVIDNVRQGQFLPAYFSTLRAVFGEKNVRLIMPDYYEIQDNRELDLDAIGTISCLLVASPGELNIADFEANLEHWKKTDGYQASARVVPQHQCDRYLASRARQPMILTDDHVPVDNLIAPMFEERFGYQRH